MRIKIRGIRDAGVPEKERLALDVTQDDDIGSYVVFHTRVLKPEIVSARVRRAYWFPDKPVKPGDVVVLYTKRGTQNEKKHEDGTTSHFFYWNQEAPLWKDRDVTAVLAFLEEWEMVSR